MYKLCLETAEDKENGKTCKPLLTDWEKVPYSSHL